MRRIAALPGLGVPVAASIPCAARRIAWKTAIEEGAPVEPIGGARLLDVDPAQTVRVLEPASAA
jgi:hypothetical protein